MIRDSPLGFLQQEDPCEKESPTLSTSMDPNVSNPNLQKSADLICPSTNATCFHSQKEQLHSYLNHAFDVPVLSIQKAFDLLFAFMQQQHEQLRAEQDHFKAYTLETLRSQEELLHNRLEEIQQTCEEKLQKFREEEQTFLLQVQQKTASVAIDNVRSELVQMIQTHEANTSTVYENLIPRFGKIEETTNNLIIEFEILQESLLGGPDITGIRPVVVGNIEQEEESLAWDEDESSHKISDNTNADTVNPNRVWTDRTMSDMERIPCNSSPSCHFPNVAQAIHLIPKDTTGSGNNESEESKDSRCTSSIQSCQSESIQIQQKDSIAFVDSVNRKDGEDFSRDASSDVKIRMNDTWTASRNDNDEEKTVKSNFSQPSSKMLSVCEEKRINDIILSGPKHVVERRGNESTESVSKAIVENRLSPSQVSQDHMCESFPISKGTNLEHYLTTGDFHGSINMNDDNIVSTEGNSACIDNVCACRHLDTDILETTEHCQSSVANEKNAFWDEMGTDTDAGPPCSISDFHPSQYVETDKASAVYDSDVLTTEDDLCSFRSSSKFINGETTSVNCNIDSRLQKTTDIAADSISDEYRNPMTKASSVINSIFQTVRLKRNSVIMQRQTNFSQAQGVIVHLLDQEKKVEHEIHDLSNRLDILTNLLNSEDNRSSRTLKIPSPRVHPNINERDVNPLMPQIQEGKEGVYKDTESSNEIKFDDLTLAVSKLTAVVETRVAKDHLHNILRTFHKAFVHDTVNSAVSDEDFITELISALRKPVESSTWKNLSKEEIKDELASFRDCLWTDICKEISDREIAMKEAISKINRIVSSSQDSMDRTSNDFHGEAVVTTSEVDEKIKVATEAVHVSLQRLISSNLRHLDAIEEEIGKLSVQLAERPDEEQVNKMISDLDYAVSQRIGKNDVLQVILENLRQECKKRMTKEEVLNLIKIFLHNAKDDIQNQSSSLMIGRAPYKCIGCNRNFNTGVHGEFAVKVNHDTLLPPHVRLAPIYTTAYSSDNYGYYPAKGPNKVLESSKLSCHHKNRPLTSADLRRAPRKSSDRILLKDIHRRY